jgi:hypothetical protein
MSDARACRQIGKRLHRIFKERNNRWIGGDVDVPLNIEILVPRGNGSRNISLHSDNPVILIVLFLNDGH